MIRDSVVEQKRQAEEFRSAPGTLLISFKLSDLTNAASIYHPMTDCSRRKHPPWENTTLPKIPGMPELPTMPPFLGGGR